MSSDETRHERVSRLFLQAVDLPPEQRESFVADACTDCPELVREVLGLLEADEAAPECLRSGELQRRIAQELDRPPRKVGDARVIRKIGEGGMGVVYLAEQESPVRRQVAIKLIKRGFETERVVARFESERQALAMMSHPSIAQIYDAGIADGGRPYFSMELVDGVPITDYCDRERMSLPERIDLFIQLCEAVQHAHHRAVIHRDIKPSNILVTTRSGHPLPKIIDFGVAKATERSLTDRALPTESGQLVGTPEFMSPEQAGLNDGQVDTRTDVYSLGVVLYELLTGVQPLESDVLRSAPPDEVRRRIREDEAPKPSVRLGSHPDRSALAKARGTDDRSLIPILRRELDWVAMRALAKEPDRRYGSPSELANDLRRYLQGEPVEARPPSRTYRLGKFVRKHKMGVGLTVTLVLSLAVIAAAGFVQNRRIVAERNRADQEAANAHQVADFLAELLGDMEPSRLGSVFAADLRRQLAESGRAGGASDEQVARSLASLDEILQQVNETDLALRLIDEEIFGHVSAKIEDGFGEQPRIEAQLRRTIAKTYRTLGLFGPAEPHALLAVEISSRALGPDDADTLRSVNELANLYSTMGRYREAEPLFEDSLAAQRRVHGDDHPDTLALMGNLGSLYYYQGRDDEAEALYRQTLEGQERILGPDAPERLVTMANLASLYFNQGRNDQAEPLYLEAITAQKRVLGTEHPDTLLSMGNLASLYVDQKRFGEAEALFLATLDAQESLLGEHHPDLAGTLWGLARLRALQGDLQRAKALFERSLQLELLMLGDDHPEFAYSEACHHAILGHSAEALASLRRAIQLGYSDAAWMASDGDLDPLRGEPEFDAILASIADSPN